MKSSSDLNHHREDQKWNRSDVKNRQSDPLEKRNEY